MADRAPEPGKSKLDVGVLMLPGQVPLDLAGPLQVLHSAQRLGAEITIRFFGPQCAIDWLGPLVLSGIEPLLDTPAPLSLLLVPGQYKDGIQPTLQNVCADWLRQHAAVAETIMAVCSGSLLLAQAGLLDHRRCTTHHSLLDVLRDTAPLARVQADCIFVEDGPYLTSAGISTGIDTVLHWLTRRQGHRHTLAVAREMVLYLRRSGHEPQLGAWLTGRNHVDARIHRLQDAISTNLKKRWSLATMAAEAAMSERHLRRHFSTLTGMPPGEYVTRLRLQLAQQLMCETRWNMARIAEEIGLGEDRQLRRAWKRFEKSSPRTWRQAHLG